VPIQIMRSCKVIVFTALALQAACVTPPRLEEDSLE
jgi:hypothetical protein